MSATAITTATAIELKSINEPDHVSGASLAVASGLPSSKAQSIRSDANAAPISENVDGQEPSRFTTTVVIVLVTLVTTLSTLCTGFVTVAIPTIAIDVNLSQNLILWYVSNTRRRDQALTNSAAGQHPSTP